MEQWKDIPGYEGFYQVSSEGRVYSSTLVMMKPVVDYKGYLRVRLSRKGEYKTFRVHQLVALTFIGPRPDGLQINHLDGNKQNNRPENLEYVTGAQNMKHAKEMGLNTYSHTVGDKNGAAKLTEDQVREIKRLLRDTELSQRAIGDVFGVEKSIISLIHCGKNWKSVTL